MRLLLDFASTFPLFENDIGLSWVDDETFRINKRALSGVMGVKINTLNVNLRDLEFRQQNAAKSGWTTWKKDGFTRHALPPGENSAGEFGGPALPRIGKVPPEIEAVMSLAEEPFLEKAAARFKTEQQAMENAVKVLRAIVCPTHEAVVTEAAFVRFMAMFGPASTAMLKIASLLEISEATGRWLVFDTGAARAGFHAMFDTAEANCLLLRNGQAVTHVWNLPHVDSREDYIVDERGKTYASWSDYFTQHPAHPAATFGGLFLNE
jgi:hypothetical protein